MSANPERLVGVLGGYGAVGSATARLLRERGDVTLRIGGRDPDRAARFVSDDLGGAGEAIAVDVYDEEALARFCDGCRLVVNAGAPSYLTVDRVARAALAAGADYVDAGGDCPLFDRLVGTDLAGDGRRALVTAGMMPGLSGLVPRWLAAQGFARVTRLTAYIGVMDRLTPAGAVDYLLSLGEREAESQAVWLGGRRVRRQATPLADVELPFFPGRVTAYPYLGYEGERLARQLGIDELAWYSVFDGGASMMATLSRLQGAMSGESDLTAAAAELASAAELDMFGRDPYQLMVFEAHGEATGGGDVSRTCVVRSEDTSRLTGTVCALATIAVLQGRVRPGVWFAAEGLDPAWVVDELRSTGAVRAFELYDGPADVVSALEEGVL